MISSLLPEQKMASYLQGLPSHQTDATPTCGSFFIDLLLGTPAAYSIAFTSSVDLTCAGGDSPTSPVRQESHGLWSMLKNTYSIGAFHHASHHPGRMENEERVALQVLSAFANLPNPSFGIQSALEKTVSHTIKPCNKAHQYSKEKRLSLQKLRARLCMTIFSRYPTG